MSAKKIITVFGATGAQGGGVVSTFLSDPKLNDVWAIRGVTRDTTSDSATKLTEKGVEVVSADFNDKASLVRAMTGADTVFAVTNYWEKVDQELEEQQGRNLADAAKDAGVKHYIWSSLFDITQMTNGKLSRVYHFDSKAHVEEYVRTLGIPASFFYPGLYMPNLSESFFTPPSPPTSTTWTFSLPIAGSSPIPLFEPRDTGKYVKVLVQRRDELLGKRLLSASQYLTCEEIVEGFRRVFPEAGGTAHYIAADEAGFRVYMASAGTPELIIDALYDTFALLQDHGYYGGAPLDETHRLVEDHLTTWEEHLKASEKLKDLK
ncbi:NmrA-like family protein [Biscogniauxia sp. FL1348]|nr:NmrA-like family protein [Biscogniauxia sp. FL1348]